MPQLLDADALLARAEAALTVTHQSATQYLRAATVGQRVRVRVELVRRTRALAFAGVTAERETDGVVLAQGHITTSVVAF